MARATKRRCAWAESDPLLRDYHDTEWGIPERDGRALWETLMLEGQQAGLAWIVVLRKRDTLRRAYAGFEPERVARFGARDVARLMKDTGVIRARAKIDGVIASARVYCELEERGESFAELCWSYTDGKVLRGNGRSVPSSTPLSERISKDFKRRGLKFVGPTIVYAWMQAVGIVDDHLRDCFRRKPGRTR